MDQNNNPYLFTYHLIKLPFFGALKNVFFPLNKSKIDGLIHAQTMTAMQLGSSIFSATRLFSTKLVVFAQWQDETSFSNFLQSHAFGKKLSKSWYIKLKFMRQWGAISNFVIPQTTTETTTENQPVVAITLARMKYREIPRFLRWGRPVEKLVRDHYATTLSLASIRYPNLISTFSIWNSQKEMLQMVHGHSKVEKPKGHAQAMKERDRKDFHFEFTTLRFSPISEHGQWKDKKDYLPKITI